ncbi:MAG: hypothetical protein L6Q33_07510 [Bacteriovoracaceae bacterium]|nr:hypothetical protein [Bacteriovoracaceae bacterium]
MKNETVTTNSIDLAFDSLNSCTAYIDHINTLIYRLIDEYQAGDSNKANQTFIEVIELLDLYVQLMTKIYSSLRFHFKDKLFKDDSVQNLEIHLLSVMKALLPAKEKGDVIMLCDLLEYELIDNLTQWKIKVIPELKKLK